MNISTIHDCFGCGVCSMACRRNIIDIHLNSDGFYEAFITDPTKCVDCGLCVEVCSYRHDDYGLKNKELHSYAAWSRDSAVRRKCSSGGVAFEMGKHLINQGFQVLGCRYNAESNKAEHYIATTVEELVQSIGSKYIQSYTVKGLKQIDRKKKYLVTGTPCQIDSFRRFTQYFHCEDNFILMDFFCHGVPSKFMWDKYVKWAEKQVGALTYVAWRNKQTGWHDSWSMAIDGEKHGEPIDWHESYNLLIKEKKSFLNSRMSQGDMFYQLFLGDVCLGKACYERCRFKGYYSSADIRIGDAWGKVYAKDREGVSSVLSLTIKGNEILESLNCEITEQSFEVISEGQMKNNPVRPPIYDVISKKLRNPNAEIEDISRVLKNYLRVQRIKRWVTHPFQTSINLIKKMI